MDYFLLGTEKTKEKGSDFETKAMFYMMNYYEHANKIEYFVIDFFNDVTGVDVSKSICFDLQSKGMDKIGPQLLGECLATLFRNYLSKFNFKEFILFIEGVGKRTKDVIKEKNIFYFDDLSNKLKEAIIKGLEKESAREYYAIDKSDITEENIKKFLKKVIFVIGTHSKEKYIGDAFPHRPSLIVDSQDLIDIFDEIRNMQSSKKMRNLEGKLVKSIGCFLEYSRYLTKKEIQNFIVQRVCSQIVIQDADNHSFPKSFLEVINLEKPLEQSELNTCVELCQGAVFRLLCSNYNEEYFWDLFEEIIVNIISDPKKNVNEIYDSLNEEKVNKVHYFSKPIYLKYYIASIKEVIE